MSEKLDLTLAELTAQAKKERQAENAKQREAKAAEKAQAKTAAAVAAKATKAAAAAPKTAREPRKPAAQQQPASASGSQLPALSSAGFAVIVANLNEGLQADELKGIFEQELKFKLKAAEQLKFNNKWHACRLVFKKKPEADRAVLEFNGRLLDGRELKVSHQAAPRERKTAAGDQPSSNAKRARLGPAPTKN